MDGEVWFSRLPPACFSLWRCLSVEDNWRLSGLSVTILSFYGNKTISSFILCKRFLKYMIMKLICMTNSVWSYEQERCMSSWRSSLWIYEYESDVHINMNKYNGKMGFYSECNRGRLMHTLSVMIRVRVWKHTPLSKNVAKCTSTLAHSSSLAHSVSY